MLNWGEIEIMWQSFSENHGMTHTEIDQHLIINKRQIYTATEQVGNYRMQYRYMFYKLDTLNIGNDFRILIPVRSDFEMLIRKPNVQKQLFKRSKITIKSTNRIQISDKIQSLLISNLRIIVI